MSVPDTYLDALSNELSFYKRLYGIEYFQTVYIGGGTPSLLSPHQLSKLLSSVYPERKPPEELTIEMNPESISENLLECFASSPAKKKRLSLGIQSLSDKALDSVGRHCKANDARKALSLVKKHWKDDLCLDLIAGLPFQTDEDLRKNIEECLACTPQHISLYSLMVEEGTPLYRNIKNLDWDSDAADEQWILGKEIIEDSGYIQYEVSNFCKKGHESLHNMAYWKQNDYIGIGSGATGSIYSYSKKGGLRWTNTKEIELYSTFWKTFSPSHDNLTTERIPRETEILPLEIEEEEFLMMGLRSIHGINSEEYKKRFRKLMPWKGQLADRLGVVDGAWKHFSALNGLTEGCLIKETEHGQQYSFRKNALSFLNTFLKLLT